VGQVPLGRQWAPNNCRMGRPLFPSRGGFLRGKVSVGVRSELRRTAAFKKLEPDEYWFRLEFNSPRAVNSLLNRVLEFDNVAGFRFPSVGQRQCVLT
jgi:hypothetical protein